MLSLKEQILRVLSQSEQPMFLHEIRAAVDAECRNTPRLYNSEAEFVAGIMELVSEGQLTTLGPAYFFKKP